MPGLNGLEVTQRIKAQPSTPRVVSLTLHDNAGYRAGAEAVGADDFITKWDLGTQWLPTINRLFGESTIATPQPTSKI